MFKKNGLKKAMEKNNMNEIELAAKLKIDTSLIKIWETGAGNIPMSILIEIAKLLHTSTEMILFAEERKPLNISCLNEDQKKVVLYVYKNLKKWSR